MSFDHVVNSRGSSCSASDVAGATNSKVDSSDHCNNPKDENILLFHSSIALGWTPQSIAIVQLHN
jgi:hypothetical protein